MKLGKACAIFEQIDSNNYTTEEKVEAICRVLDMETHNSITKNNILNAFRWVWKNITPSTDISSENEWVSVQIEDFGAVINCAIRYCIGRQTYVPGLVVDFIRPLLPHLDYRTVNAMWNDIRSATNYGDPNIDEPMWMRFLGELAEELDRRNAE